MGFNPSRRAGRLAWLRVGISVFTVALTGCGGRTIYEGESRGSETAAASTAVSTAGGTDGSGGSGGASTTIGGGDGAATHTVGPTATTGNGASTASVGGAGGGATSTTAPHTDGVWRMSEDPFCAAAMTYPPDGISIWSDTRGVYVLLNRIADAQAYHNSGSGWDDVDGEWDGKQLTGFVDGPVVAYGAPSGCTIEFVEDGIWSCSGAAVSATKVFTVTDALAYAIYADLVLKFDGAGWTQWGDALPPPESTGIPVVAHSLWAAPGIIICGTDQGVYVFDGDQVTPKLQGDLPHGYGQQARAVWGFGADDLWVGINDELWHYDGSSWSVVWTASPDCGGIRGMWGADQTLFFYTRHSLHVVRDDVNTLLEYRCGGDVSVRGVWGNSPMEVFVALTDRSERAEVCGHTGLLWFDGSVFAPL